MKSRVSYLLALVRCVLVRFRDLLVPTFDSNAERYEEIDGIRGWASLFVLVHHIRYMAFAKLQIPIDWKYFVFADGPAMVRTFFILSGDALSLSVTRPNSKGFSSGSVL
jgi:peptidoglycan/LPS O-acetylase OafA/YrhL